MMPVPFDRAQIICQAFSLVDAVGRLAEQARWYYYQVTLSRHACPSCGGSLLMVGEGRCECQTCRDHFDPTIAFQVCQACGGRPALRIRRYQCDTCGEKIVSRFLFDGLVFDAEYFRQKMAEHRRQKAELRERVRQMLAGTRSVPVLMPAAELEGMPDLLNALAGLTSGNAVPFTAWSAKGFDLERYQAHVLAHIGPIPVDLAKIPPLSEDRRLDLVRRFLAILFMAQSGLIHIWQEGQTIWVKQHETDREGRDVPGGTEEADGVEGPLGGAATW
jgi:hypothetical protein